MRKAWRWFRGRPWWVQVTSWVGLAVLLIAASFFGGEDTSNGTGSPAVAEVPAETPAASPTQTPTKTPTPTPTPTSTPTPSPSPTATVTLSQWRSRHGTNITLVIATANGLVRAISGNSEVALQRSCDALGNNYRRLLQPIPAPPGSLGETLGTWDSAKDAIYTAQRQCHAGFIRRSDLFTAQAAAREGIDLLNQVLG
jgi:hypothetical protein